MMTNGDQLIGKWALLDTNILIKGAEQAKDSEGSVFRHTLEYLKNRNATPYLTDITYFEFISFCRSKKEQDSLKSLINKFPIIATKREDIEEAALVSSYYRKLDPELNKRQISYCDCINAAQITKFNGRVFLMTTDIYDYPTSLFDIEHVVPISGKKRAELVACITYNKQKFDVAKESFSKS